MTTFPRAQGQIFALAEAEPCNGELIIAGSHYRRGQDRQPYPWLARLDANGLILRQRWLADGHASAICQLLPLAPDRLLAVGYSDCAFSATPLWLLDHRLRCLRSLTLNTISAVHHGGLHQGQLWLSASQQGRAVLIELPLSLDAPRLHTAVATGSAGPLLSDDKELLHCTGDTLTRLDAKLNTVAEIRLPAPAQQLLPADDGSIHIGMRHHWWQLDAGLTPRNTLAQPGLTGYGVLHDQGLQLACDFDPDTGCGWLLDLDANLQPGTAHPLHLNEGFSHLAIRTSLQLRSGEIIHAGRCEHRHLLLRNRHCQLPDNAGEFAP